MLLLPLSSPRYGRQRRASLLLLAAVLLCVVSVGASLPAHSRCPGPIECAKQRRHFCQHGSSHCGRCISPLRENEEGHCVLMRHRQHGKMTSYADLDEEIDFLDSVIEKQEVSEVKTPEKQSKHPADITPQTDVKNSKTVASKHQQQNQLRLSAETQQTTTAAPRPVVTALPSTPTPQPRVTGTGGRGGPVAVPTPKNDSIIVVIISLCVVVGTVAVSVATVCFIKLQKESRLAEKVDYPAFGGVGVPPPPASGTVMGDKTLAQNAQMYHYQHQKQQMLSMGNHKPEQKANDNEVTSDEEEVGGDFTVYECPGLAPTGEMEVKNPLFDDSTIHYQGNHK
ncbi:neural proliferation differentiation and control protein 1a isoform X2 [Acanthochromis polyacanthus]|uniref:Neural proliferation, differentiation and control, 1a n=1 Tax=Acanthochromis polyacanthus TaxID=80966 RepID=A0A3Q1H8G9_9TELE|nr:neural proliferation differentiation and control protein 1a isoform X2 [Acanthochromis polyacanthus]